jgi:hypothetical protein
MRPNSNSCEEVALVVVSEVFWSDIFNTPFIDVAGGDEPRGDQVA